MRHSRSFFHVPASVLSLVFNGFLGVGCVADGAETHPADARTTSVEISDPIDGATVAVTTPILRLTFSDPIDPRRSDLRGAMSLSTGSLSVPVRTSVDPILRTMTGIPADPLVPGLRYTWEVDDTRLRGAGGRLLSAIEPVSFRVGIEATATTEPGGEIVRWDQVAPLFEAHCGCHGEGVLLPLTTDTLMGRSPSVTDRRLVVPYDASTSYLVEKLVPGYPDRFGVEMPPPWSEQPALSSDSLRRIVDWIDDGAHL